MRFSIYSQKSPKKQNLIINKILKVALSRSGGLLDENSFKTWVKNVLDTDPTAYDGDAANSLGTLIQPSTQVNLSFSARAATSGDIGTSLHVYFADGTTTSTVMTSTSSDTVICDKVYGTAAQRYVFWLGKHRQGSFVAFNSSKVYFGGTISWMFADVTTYCIITGSNTVSGVLPSGLTYCMITGSNTVSGVLPSGLTYCIITDSNTVSGVLPSGLTYCIITGSNTVSGVLPSGLKTCIITGSNTVSGVTNAALEYFYNSSALNTVTYDAVSTALCYYLNAKAISEAEVNATLAGFWVNRDAAKPSSDRTIDLNDNASSAAPTGQGIIDKSALQAYRSPSNDPTKPLWTVNTK